jgi:hypothetical protein
MANNEIYINGREWHDVTNETTAERTYSRLQLERIDGDPRRLDEIRRETSTT